MVACLRQTCVRGRCRVLGDHAPQTCDEYEAQRGYEDVCRCLECGIYIVKGDGEIALVVHVSGGSIRRWLK